MENVRKEELSSIEREALNEAALVMELAYNPYSKFYVGACLITTDDKLITGANVENAAYGSVICAERSALTRANAMGMRHIKAIAIIARGEDFDTTEVTGPCGACRQMLYETSQISDCDIKIILATSDQSKITVTTINELLPLAFGPVDLGIDVEKFLKK